MKKLCILLIALLLSENEIALAADTTTTNLSLTKPDAVTGSWGEKYNDNFDLIDDWIGAPKLPATTTLPATCTANRQIHVDSDATPAGQQVYLCNSTGDGWNLVGDGGSGGGGTGDLTEVQAGCFLSVTSGTGPIPLVKGGISINAQTGTSYTYEDGDCGKLVTHSNGSAIAGTLPDPEGVGFDEGWFIDVQNRGAGALTITPTTSTIDGAASLILTQHQGVRIVSNGSDYYTQRGIGGAGGSITGTLTSGKIPKASGANTLIDSSCSDDGTTVQCGTGTSGTFVGALYVFPESTAPGAGTNAGEHNFYVDAADSKFKSHENSGSVVTYFSTANAPAFSDITGTATDAQSASTISRDAEVQSGVLIYVADAGANDTYTACPTPALTAYTTGMVVTFKPNTNNTGAATLNLCSLGAKAIVDAANGALTDNALVAGSFYSLYYDGTSFRMPQDAGGAGAGDVTDVWGCNTGNCNALTAAVGDSFDASLADSFTVRKGAGLAPTADGSLGYDTTKDALVAGGAGALTATIPRVLSIQTSTSDTITASVVGTTQTNFTTSFSLPANYFTVGKTVRLTLGKQFTSSASSVPTSLQRPRLGSVNGYSHSATALPSGVTDGGMSEVYVIICTATGASGTFEVYQAGGSGPISTLRSTTAMPITADTTGAIVVRSSHTFGAATAGNSVTLRLYILEELN